MSSEDGAEPAIGGDGGGGKRECDAIVCWSYAARFDSISLFPSLFGMTKENVLNIKKSAKKNN